MKKSRRLVIEIMGPALVGTVLLFVWKQEEFCSTSGITSGVFFSYLVFAYAFAIIPSLVYAFVMEASLKRSARVRFGALGVVLLSTLLGGAAGGVIMLASEAPVVWIGTLVGLILGVILSLGVSRDEKRPNQTPQRNAGTRPPSSDSSSSKNQPSLGPRG